MTFDEFEGYVDDLVEFMKSKAGDYELLAANSANAMIKRRLFTGASEDVENSRLTSRSSNRTGAYSKGHARTRRRDGRQTSFIDLQHTDQLRKSINVGEVGGGIAVGVTVEGRERSSATNTELLEYLEEAFSTEIFGLSEEEADKVIDVVTKRANNDFDGFK